MSSICRYLQQSKTVQFLFFLFLNCIEEKKHLCAPLINATMYLNFIEESNLLHLSNYI